MNNSLGLLGTTIEHRSVFGAAWIALTAVRQFPADIGTYAESVQWRLSETHKRVCVFLRRTPRAPHRPTVSRPSPTVTWMNHHHHHRRHHASGSAVAVGRDHAKSRYWTALHAQTQALTHSVRGDASVMAMDVCVAAILGRVFKCVCKCMDRFLYYHTFFRAV